MDSPVMTIEDLSEYLRIHRSTCYRLCKGGKIPHFKIGSDYRFNRESIDAWMVSAQVNQGRAGK